MSTPDGNPAKKVMFTPNWGVYKSLPSEVYTRSSTLINLPQDGKADKREEFVDFLGSYVPIKNQASLESEINVGFGLSMKRKKKRKRQKKGNQNTGEHRGKKRLSGSERRALGIHKIDRDNKTFAMFIPINEMWKTYAQHLFSMEFLLKQGYKGANHDKRTEAVQNKVRKMEYFGCLIRVTKSLCSEYIGTTGIVIKETKNTFVMICPDDKVRTIPKLHSEFSFVVQGVGFSISGNFLHQRSAERAKNKYKKLSLWL